MDRPRRTPVIPLATVLGVVLAGALTTLPFSSALSPALLPAAHAGTAGGDVVARDVVIAVENTNATPVACAPDDKSYVLHAQLVGPRHEVLGANVPRMNVLVHDLATGSWFWHLRRHPAYDYAGKLAAAGETSLVLDRLGYGASRLPEGNATCLGAQADMLHQVVQHLRSGRYRFEGSMQATPGGPARGGARPLGRCRDRAGGGRDLRRRGRPRPDVVDRQRRVLPGRRRGVPPVGDVPPG